MPFPCIDGWFGFLTHCEIRACPIWPLHTSRQDPTTRYGENLWSTEETAYREWCDVLIGFSFLSGRPRCWPDLQEYTDESSYKSAG